MPSFNADPVIEVLAHQLQQSAGSSLWLAEEQAFSPLLLPTLIKRQTTYLSNRFDQVESMQRAGVRTEFHDFEQALLQDRQFDHIFLRVPKQRALVHHLLNLAPGLLSGQGALWIAGFKGEGIRTHVQRAEGRLGCKARKLRAAKSVDLYSLHCQSIGAELDDQDYAQLRQLELAPGLTLWTKPGIYGWNKVDRGSALLVEMMQQLYPDLAGKAVLDLGCGYGYLAIQAARLVPDRLIATDNNAAAVAVTAANLAYLGTQAEVVASDCANSINQSFDLVLCNPPFHQGFSVTQSLHKKFLSAIVKVLKPEGRALLVVNSFLRLDNLCGELGLEILQSWQFDDDNFKVMCLARTGGSRRV